MMDGFDNSFIRFTFNQPSNGMVKGFINGWPQKKLPLTDFRQYNEDDEKNTWYKAEIKFEDGVTFDGQTSLNFLVRKWKQSDKIMLSLGQWG